MDIARWARTLLFLEGKQRLSIGRQGEKPNSFLAEAPEWLQAFPREEAPPKFEEQFYTVQPGEDLYFSPAWGGSPVKKRKFGYPKEYSPPVGGSG